jgi:hypothetical protein
VHALQETSYRFQKLGFEKNKACVNDKWTLYRPRTNNKSQAKAEWIAALKEAWGYNAYKARLAQAASGVPPLVDVKGPPEAPDAIPKARDEAAMRPAEISEHKQWRDEFKAYLASDHGPEIDPLDCLDLFAVFNEFKAVNKGEYLAQAPLGEQWAAFNVYKAFDDRKPSAQRKRSHSDMRGQQDPSASTGAATASSRALETIPEVEEQAEGHSPVAKKAKTDSSAGTAASAGTAVLAGTAASAGPAASAETANIEAARSDE